LNKTLEKKYEVKFTGLAVGKHSFAFQIDKSFFSGIENALIEEADVMLDLCLEKQNEHLFLLNFKFTGNLLLECDRCLNKIEFNLNQKYDMVMKIGNFDHKTESEDIIFISPFVSKISIVTYVNDFLLMQIPLKITCDMVDKECDKVMIDRLNNLSNK